MVVVIIVQIHFSSKNIHPNPKHKLISA